MVDFQDWITKQIDDAGITKRELAERAGISASLVYAVTTEGRKASADFCVRVAPVLGIPTLELLRRAGFSTLPPPTLPTPFSPSAGASSPSSPPASGAWWFGCYADSSRASVSGTAAALGQAASIQYRKSYAIGDYRYRCAVG